MKMTMFMPLLAIIVIGITSCSKKDDLIASPSSQATTVGMIPLTIGNYWVYERYQIDTLGNETRHPRTDSAYISRDTTISGNKYFIVEGNPIAVMAVGGRLLRNVNQDVVFYDITQNIDIIQFTKKNLGNVFKTDTIRDGGLDLFALETRINHALINTSTSLGNFTCYEKEQKLTPIHPNYPWGTRLQHTYYNKNIGVAINQFFFYAAPFMEESRLLRYHLN